MNNNYVQGLNVIPLLAPVNTTSSAVATPFVSLGSVHEGGIYVMFGTLTGGSAGDDVTVTLEAATTGASGSEAAVAFDYRLSSAVGANAYGAITAATSAGVAIDEATDDNKTLYIHIDPAALQLAKADATHVRAVITPAASFSACNVAAFAELSQRNIGATLTSAT